MKMPRFSLLAFAFTFCASTTMSAQVATPPAPPAPTAKPVGTLPDNSPFRDSTCSRQSYSRIPFPKDCPPALRTVNTYSGTPLRGHFAITVESEIGMSIIRVCPPAAIPASSSPRTPRRATGAVS